MRTKLLFTVELRLCQTKVRGVAQGLEYTEHAQGPGSVPALQNNNRMSKPPKTKTNTSARTDTISKAKSASCC